MINDIEYRQKQKIILIILMKAVTMFQRRYISMIKKSSGDNETVGATNQKRITRLWVVSDLPWPGQVS